MSESHYYYLRSIARRKSRNKDSLKICDRCGHTWKGFSNSRCPKCREKNK